MPEDFRDRPSIRALLVQERGAGVPKIVEADLTDARPIAQRLESAVQVPGLDRRPVVCGEHKIRCRPLLTGRQPVGPLLRATRP